MFFLVAAIGGAIYFGGENQRVREAAGAGRSTKRSDMVTRSITKGFFNIRKEIKKQQVKVRALTAFMQIAVNIGELFDF